MPLSKAQLETVLDNVSGPMPSELFEEFYDSREFILVHSCVLATDVDEYIVFPYAGTVRKVYSVINQALTTADETIILKNGADSLGTITITQSGSAAGDVDSLTPLANNVFTEGEAMLIEIGGENGTAAQCDLTIIYQLS